MALFVVLREAGQQQILVLAPDIAHANLLQHPVPGLGGTMDHLKPPTGKTSVLSPQHSQHSLSPGLDPQQALEASTRVSHQTPQSSNPEELFFSGALPLTL